jgi:glyoxylase-like metal-dependent hydrolase (beta-lactamase superfamily II)
VRVVSLHPDVLVATSAIWQTNCVIVRAQGSPESAAGLGWEGTGGSTEAASARVRESQAGETFVIDSPILPDELDALPSLAEQARFPTPSGLLATHGDWDHLLGRLAFPSLALGCAQSTAERLSAEPGGAQRELRAFDEGLYIDRPSASRSRALRDRRAGARAASCRGPYAGRNGRLDRMGTGARPRRLSLYG